MSPFVTDLIILGLFIISAGLGYMRGFVNEVFTIIGWLAAIIATIFLTPVLDNFVQPYFDSKMVAGVVTAAVIFVVTLGISSLISHAMAGTLKASHLGFVDRGLGLAFGVLRAAVVIGMLYLAMAGMMPETRPKWLAKATTEPVMKLCAQGLQTIFPMARNISLDIIEKTGKKAKDSAEEVAE